MAHPFVIGERYSDRRGEYRVIEIKEKVMTIEYEDGARAENNIDVKERIYRNILAEHKVLHPILSESYFNFMGFLARTSDFNAEVPPQSQTAFEERYYLLTGTRPRPHQEGYFPISIRTTWDKWAPELRIYFPKLDSNFDLPPEVEVRAGNEPGIQRINNNRFWWNLVTAGFRLGRAHEITKIRAGVPAKFRDTFSAALK